VDLPGHDLCAAYRTTRNEPSTLHLTLTSPGKCPSGIHSLSVSAGAWSQFRSSSSMTAHLTGFMLLSERTAAGQLPAVSSSRTLPWHLGTRPVAACWNQGWLPGSPWSVSRPRARRRSWGWLPNSGTCRPVGKRARHFTRVYAIQAVPLGIITRLSRASLSGDGQVAGAQNQFQILRRTSGRVHQVEPQKPSGW